MILHRVTYTTENEDGDWVDKQEFFASDAKASKRCTELKTAPKTIGKPSRAPVDVPTTKADLIEWLNTHANLACVPEQS